MATRGSRSRQISAIALLFLTTAALGVSVSATTYAGLYDSDAASIKSGPILDRDYWRAKWDSMRLEDAIKERQPEGAVLIAVIGQIQLLDDLIKKYPNDQELKDWKGPRRRNPGEDRSEREPLGSVQRRMSVGRNQLP